MTESEQLDQALTNADARKWRYKAEQAEAALAAMQTPCGWQVKAPAHFVGHMDDKPLEMILVATSCGKELGVQLPPPYCAYCGHPVEVQP